MSVLCIELFRYAASRVSLHDVAEFAPDDPGYDDYVAEWRRIVSMREVPKELNFDVSETIGLTQWSPAESMRHPSRYRRFRVLMNSTGLAMIANGIVQYDQLPANYLLANLIEDARKLSDQTLNERLLSAVDEFESLQGAYGVEEHLFVQLGRVLLRLITRQDEKQLPELAEALIAAESQIPKLSSVEFLWGCTYFNQLHAVWKKNVDALIPKDCPISALALLRNALLVQP